MPEFVEVAKTVEMQLEKSTFIGRQPQGTNPRRETGGVFLLP